MLGRYEVEKELGKGAMGVVYLGRDPETRLPVAIKTMAFAQEFDDELLADVKNRFFLEAEAAGRLKHPNIVEIYDSGEDHELAYIAMEFLQGHDLTLYCRQDRLMPVNQSIEIVINAASALDYAHENGVIHRDVKPANIMFNPETKIIKITDFGIARIANSGATRSGKILGTPSFMSPEQLFGRRVDGRSDLFSLGVTFYELLTGKLPFTGNSLAELMHNIANKRHVNIMEANPLLVDQAPYLSSIIDRSLQKKVEERYQSGEEMIADLIQYISGDAVA